MRSNDTISKINTVNGVTGNAYLTNSDSITVDNVTYDIDNGFDFYGLDTDVQEAAKFKKTFNIGSIIPFVNLDSRISLIENYDEAHRYVYENHSCFSNTNVNNGVNLPKFLAGWNYYSNETPVTLPQTLTQTLAENFVNGNLDVFANWGSIFAIRVIVFLDEKIPSSITPLCNVSIASNRSYTGSNQLSINYSKLVHRNANANDNVHSWTFFQDEFGTNTPSGAIGNGCPVLDDDGYKIPCYYGVKSNDNITITLNGLNGKYDNQTLIEAFKPYYSENNYICYFEEVLTSYFSEPKPQNLSQSNGSFYCQKNNISTDLTFFFPIVLNLFKIVIKCVDSSSNERSVMGYVGINSIINNSDLTDFPLYADCVNNETVTIVASPKTGYVFSHWEDGNGTTLSEYSGNTFRLDINSSVDENVYVACFTSGEYQIVYHKQTQE